MKNKEEEIYETTQKGKDGQGDKEVQLGKQPNQMQPKNPKYGEWILVKPKRNNKVVKSKNPKNMGGANSKRRNEGRTKK